MSASTTTLRHQKFSVEEDHHFIEQGVFKPEERIVPEIKIAVKDILG